MDAFTFLRTVSRYVRGQGPAAEGRVSRLGIVDPAYDPATFPGTLPRVQFDGETQVSPRRYPVLSPYTPEPGARVLLIPSGTTYVIAGGVVSG